MSRSAAARATAAFGIVVLSVTGATAAQANGTGAATQVSAAAGLPTDWGHGWDPSYGMPWSGVVPGSGSAVPGYGDSSTTTQESLSRTAQQAAETVTPAVVNIDTVLDYGTAQAAGTGIVMRADGIVLTNHHVVEGATSVTATVVGTGRTYQATVLGYDETTDIAVLQLTDASGLPVAELGDSDSVDVGELVVGVGNAGGDGGEPTSVEGVVTALDQTITATDAGGGNPETLNGLIATDADVQSGQSGGPLVDASGAVVGVDVAASSTHGSTDSSGYAIPIDDAVTVAEQIVAGQGSATVHVGETAFLGVQLGSSGYGTAQGGWGRAFGVPSGYSTAASGVTITGVVEGSAAQSAGLSGGDTITGFAGSAVTSADDLSRLVAARAVGDRVTIEWTDASGTGHRASVRLGAGPVG